MASTINASTTAGLIQTADTSGVLALQTAGTTAVTVDASQNVTLAGTLTTAAQSIAKASLPTGSVLQVVFATYSTTVNISTGTYTDTGLTATITPSSASSKILVIVNQSGINATTSSNGVNVQILRGASSIAIYAVAHAFIASAICSASSCYLDSPSTTSATTYKTQFARFSGAGTVQVQANGDVSTITLMEIAA